VLDNTSVYAVNPKLVYVHMCVCVFYEQIVQSDLKKRERCKHMCVHERVHLCRQEYVLA
jgi:hypothetical protein